MQASPTQYRRLDVKRLYSNNAYSMAYRALPPSFRHCLCSPHLILRLAMERQAWLQLFLILLSTRLADQSAAGTHHSPAVFMNQPHVVAEFDWKPPMTPIHPPFLG